METTREENKMGVLPIPRLLISMSLPMIISMLVQALYNIVDSVFVSRIEENALAALTLAFPVQSLMIALSGGMAVGINSVLSRSLGEKRFEDANHSATNGVFIAAVSTLIFMIFGLFFSRIYFSSQTDNTQIVEYGVQYLSICTIFSVGLFMQMTFERLLQSTGKTIYSMITQGTGAIINIIFDPILIFGLFGFPKMGVAGAAIATVFGQCVAMILAIFLNFKVNKELTLDFFHFRPNARIIKMIFNVGIPSVIMQAIGSVMTLGFNNILLMFSDTAVSVFGVYFRLQSFAFMPVFGLNNGMVPIIAYNYGAKHRKRITTTIILSIALAVSIMLIGLCIFQLIPDKLLTIFSASESMMTIGVPALRTISLCFIFAGAGIVLSSVFQAVGKGMYSLIVSLARQLFVILPVAYVLAKVAGLHAVWYSFPIAEIVSAILSSFFYYQVYVKLLKKLDE